VGRELVEKKGVGSWGERDPLERERQRERSCRDRVTETSQLSWSLVSFPFPSIVDVLAMGEGAG
jgi:hypothetical protein